MTRTPTTRRPRGFTLMETLVAMGIFLVGVIAVAAVFPTAITVQKATVDDLTSQVIARNARNQMVALAASAQVQTDPFTYYHENAYASRSGTLVSFSQNLRVKSLWDHRHPGYGASSTEPQEIDLPMTPVYTYDTPPASRAALTAVLPLQLRTYPTTLPLNERQFEWFPFLKIDGLGTGSIGWRTFVMICRRGGPEVEPAIYGFNVSVGTGIGQFRLNTANNDPDDDGVPDYIRPGDWVLADNGLVHRVVLADAGTVTVNSPTLSSGSLSPQRLFFAAYRDPTSGDPLPNYDSPIVRIDEFQLPVMDRH